MKYKFKACSKAKGKVVDQLCIILDIENIGITDLFGKTRAFLTLSTKLGQDYYPSNMAKMFLINTSRLFYIIFNIVKPLLGSGSRKKIELLGNDYKANNIYFKDYLITISLEIFFDSVKDVKQNAVECEERKNFFDYIIDTDIKEFKEQLFKIIINNDIKLMDNKIKINFILNILEKIIIKTKYNFGLMLLKIVKEELNSNLPDDIIEFIIKTENKNGFNSLVKKSKGINEFIIFNIFMLNNMSKEFANNEKNNTLIDIYLSNVLNILCIQNEFNIQIINYIYNYY
jgi:hypothetical protein